MSERLAIVTGVGSGIGKATALVLAQRGYDLGMTYGTNADAAARTADAVKAIGRRAFVERMHLEEPDSISHAIELLSNQLGGLDAFVNNAGLLDFKRFRVPNRGQDLSQNLAVHRARWQRHRIDGRR